MRLRESARAGFTLVEMLVAAALTMFTMAIITQAFVTSLEVFSQLKGIGDMQQGLRTAATILRSDLGQDHFEGARRLSEPLFWDTPVDVMFLTYPQMKSATANGFFHIRQGSASTLEGKDSTDSIDSHLAQDHVLHFTIKLRGNRPENYLATKAFPLGLLNGDYFHDPNGYFTSQWAEVAYYLVRTGTTTEPNNRTTIPPAPTGLYALYRYQAIVVPQPDAINNPPATPVSGAQGKDYIALSYIPKTGPLAGPGPQFAGDLHFAGPGELPHPKARSLDTGLVKYPVTFATRTGTTDGATTLGYSPDGTAMVDPAGAPSYTVPQIESSAALVLTNVVSFNVRVLRAGTVTDATNTVPIVITSPGHGLVTGDRVTVGGVNANAAANGTFAVTVLTADTFTLDGSDGTTSGAYTGGGTWSDADFVDVPGGQFDTAWDPAGTPPRYRIHALQITIRVWDTKTRQARQVTIVQDM